MRAMVLERVGVPLVERDLPDPTPGPGELVLDVAACGVCRTDLHVVDGELTEPKLPLVLGHEIVGRVRAVGAGVEGFEVGRRVGVPWLARTCGRCRFCRSGRENLCGEAAFTGYTVDGGYAERALCDARYAFPLGEGLDDVEAAPFLCAGLIGYRALRMAGGARRIGFYGFGAAAHVLCQVAVHQGREVLALTRPGDASTQAFARRLGAVWAGGSDEAPPEPLEAAILFAPVGALVPAALRAVERGGRVVCAGIHMSEIPAFDYSLLWGERSVRSVANLTRRDGVEFLALAAEAGVRTSVRGYPLGEANRALEDLREGRVEGAAVLVP